MALFPIANRYIAEFTLERLGVGSRLVADAVSGNTELRVSRPAVFDPGGGVIVNTFDDLNFTYGKIAGTYGDEMQQIPASGTGSITTSLLESYRGSTPSYLYRIDMMAPNDLEDLMTKYRTYDERQLTPSSDEKVWKTPFFYWATDAVIQDQLETGFTEYTPNIERFERGEFTFTTAHTASDNLFIVGYRYNPFYVMADLIRSFAADDRWHKFIRLGESARSKLTAQEISDVFEGQGNKLEGVKIA